MIKFSKKLITRIFIVSSSAFVVFLIIFFVLSNTINAHLEKRKPSLEGFFSKILKQDIKVQSVKYVFPNTLILNNILVGNIDYLDNKVPLQAAKAKLKVDLNTLIFKRRFIFDRIHIIEPQVVISDNIFLLMKLFQGNPRGVNISKKDPKIILLIDKGLLISISDDNKRIYRTLDALVEINSDKTIKSKGRLFYDRYAKDKNQFLSYDLFLQFRDKGFSIRNFEVDMADSHINLWGRFISNNLILNGYMLSKYSLREIKLDDKTLKDKIDSLFAGKIKSRLRSVTSAHTGLNITDIDCKINFNDNNLNIERLYFDLNKITFLLSGEIDFSKRTLFNIRLSSLPRVAKENRYKDVRAIDLEVDGFFKKNGFNGDIQFTFVRKTKYSLLKESLKGNLQKLKFKHVDRNLATISFLKADISYRTQTNIYDLSLSDFDCDFDMSNIFVKAIKFNSRIFDGFLNGVGKIDTRRVPYKIELDMDVRDVSSEMIHSLSKYFCKVFGKLQGKLRYRGVNNSQLTGSLLIKQGYLDKLTFFVWLADSFDMSSVKQQKFDQLSTDLIIDDDGCNLNDISLEHNDLMLKGFFKLHGEDMVTSKLSLFLGEDLVKVSRKFRSLRGVLGKDLSKIKFDFQLSGLFERMNFRWLESEFKTAIERRIPNFIERAIEARIERALESMKAKPQEEN
ncbi:MAG: hypothetical protein P9L96_02785 [Candidatus Gygaella obscura]|nr:hypothetical protein [Candidatus Gygaella obscura]